jgi:hypothetical protein
MARNPFAPPGAEVADPVSRQLPPPVQVKRACQMIVGTLVVGVITLFPGVRVPRPDEPSVPVVFSLVFLAVLVGLTILFTARIMQGRNWARWAMLAYLATGWILIGPELADDFYRSPIAAIVDAVTIPVEATACWLLFTGAGAQWFAALRAGRTRPGL